MSDEEMRQDEKERQLEARRKEYLQRLQKTTRDLKDRMRESERLTADDFAFRINATHV